MIGMEYSAAQPILPPDGFPRAQLLSAGQNKQEKRHLLVPRCSNKLLKSGAVVFEGGLSRSPRALLRLARPCDKT